MATLTTLPPFSYEMGGVSDQPPARSKRAGHETCTHCPSNGRGEAVAEDDEEEGEVQSG